MIVDAYMLRNLKRKKKQQQTTKKFYTNSNKIFAEGFKLDHFMHALIAARTRFQ